MIDMVHEKFGEWAYIELYTDGSGKIYDEKDKKVEEFDGLGEFAKILE
jgi:hypothetical protein